MALSVNTREGIASLKECTCSNTQFFPTFLSFSLQSRWQILLPGLIRTLCLPPPLQLRPYCPHLTDIWNCWNTCIVGASMSAKLCFTLCRETAYWSGTSYSASRKICSSKCCCTRVWPDFRFAWTVWASQPLDVGDATVWLHLGDIVAIPGHAPSP